ncbi:hypothetical protein FB451DRAFT_1191792 [Mycena latifolia]|nr:hypothetical protein FB451DRAFT_1191792 [Mycena latifolia]
MSLRGAREVEQAGGRRGRVASKMCKTCSEGVEVSAIAGGHFRINAPIQPLGRTCTPLWSTAARSRALKESGRDGASGNAAQPPGYVAQAPEKKDSAKLLGTNAAPSSKDKFWTLGAKRQVLSPRDKSGDAWRAGPQRSDQEGLAPNHTYPTKGEAKVPLVAARRDVCPARKASAGTTDEGLGRGRAMEPRWRANTQTRGWPQMSLADREISLRGARSSLRPLDFGEWVADRLRPEASSVKVRFLSNLQRVIRGSIQAGGYRRGAREDLEILCGPARLRGGSLSPTERPQVQFQGQMAVRARPEAHKGYQLSAAQASREMERVRSERAEEWRAKSIGGAAVAVAWPKREERWWGNRGRKSEMKVGHAREKMRQPYEMRLRSREWDRSNAAPATSSSADAPVRVNGDAEGGT